MMFKRLALSLIAACGLLIAASVPADNSLQVPDLDPAEWFDGKMGGTFGDKTVTVLPKNKRVAVLGFRVVFVTHNEAHAISRASYLPGRDVGGARAKMIVDLKGVDDATMQAITDEIYRNFLQQIKATGREVLTGADFANAYSEFKISDTMPQTVSKSATDTEGRAFSPSGIPLWWQVGEAWGDSGLGQTNMRAFNDLALKANAIAIAPAIEVDFAQMQSSGNRSALLQRTAEVGASLAMSVKRFDTRVVRTEENRYGGVVFKGDDGGLSLTKRIDSDLIFADLEQGQEEERSLLASLFIGSSSKKSLRVARTNNEAYRKVATVVLGQATQTFAKLFAQHPVAQ